MDKPHNRRTRPIIGVMGGGSASPNEIATAYQLGALIAQQGWILLSGGRHAGIMHASAQGAHDHGGLTVGILPDDHSREASPYIAVPIVTGLGHARNAINVLSSHVVIACPGGAGTISEIALALKSGRNVILLQMEIGALFDTYRQNGKLYSVDTAHEAIALIKQWLLQRA